MCRDIGHTKLLVSLIPLSHQRYTVCEYFPEDTFKTLLLHTVPATVIHDGLLEAAEELGLRPLERGFDEDPHDRVNHPEVPLLLHVPAKLRVDHPLKSAIISSVSHSHNGKKDPKLCSCKHFKVKRQTCVPHPPG